MFETLEPTRVITEQHVLHPVTTVLEEVTSKPLKATPLTISPSSAKTIQDLFPEQEIQDKKVQKAKEILGPLVPLFTKDELKDLVVQVEYLAESWLDDFEREIFSGKTLNELLHERGGL